MARARIDVAMGIERDLAIGMATEANARSRGELLALAAPAPCNVVDDDPHLAEHITGRSAHRPPSTQAIVQASTAITTNHHHGT